MPLKLSSFVAPNVRVEFFTDLLPVQLDIESGAIEFENEDEIFSDPSVLAPVECVVLVPLAGKGKKRIPDITTFFVPELDQENDQVLVPDPTLMFLLNNAAVTKQLAIDDASDTYIGTLYCHAAIPKHYYARQVGALTRKEQQRITSMNFDVIQQLKQRDPDLVNRLMTQVEQGKLTSGKIDAAINLEIALNNPDFMDVVADQQDQQASTQIAMLLGSGITPELVGFFDTYVPRGSDILSALRIDLGMVRARSTKPISTIESEIQSEQAPILDPEVPVNPAEMENLVDQLLENGSNGNGQVADDATIEASIAVDDSQVKVPSEFLVDPKLAAAEESEIKIPLTETSSVAEEAQVKPKRQRKPRMSRKGSPAPSNLAHVSVD